MKWEELELCVAIAKVRHGMKRNGEKPGAECWTAERALELTHRIMLELVNKPNPSFIDAWRQFRKTPTSYDDKKKLDIIVELCERNGPTCFYSDRGLGDCSDDVHLDRIRPGSRGGEYTIANCVLSCGRHNTMRGDKAIEEFLP